LLRLLLLFFFLRHVMADRAARRGAEQSMMAGIVPDNGADDRAFQATFRLGGIRARQHKPRGSEGDDSFHFHPPVRHLDDMVSVPAGFNGA
jgi:hypothetical protein